MQTDPIGYDDGLNIYAYVGNDPVNFVDDTGEQRRIAAPPGSGSHGRGGARSKLTQIVPDYRDRPAASSTRPSAQAARFAAESYRAELRHIQIIGAGAFQGRSVVGEGNLLTPVGRIQHAFSGFRYDGAISGGYHFRGTGGQGGADQVFESLGLSNVRSIQNGAGRAGSLDLGNGARIDVTSRQGGRGAYDRLEVLVRTERTGSRIPDQTTFKVRFDGK